MARRVAVGIGVSRVSGLTPLSGVYNGVDEFLDWARTQKFKVTPFTDAAGKVELTEIANEIENLVRAGDVEQLCIYFAGHGNVASGWQDIWLLSDAATRDYEAVNVARSANAARECGIKHVVFLGDACRTPPGKLQQNAVGASIFPTPRIAHVRVKVDRFFATRSGDPAFEKIPDDVPARAFGVFSRCLMTGLRGEAPEVVDPVAGGEQEYAVQAGPLSDYLWRRVRLTAYREVGVDQIPDCRTESAWRPHVLSWLTGPGAPVSAPLPPLPGTGVPRDGGPTDPVGTEPSEAATGESDDDLLARLDRERTAQAAELAERLAAASGRAGFETRAGLSVVGAQVSRAMVSGGIADLFPEEGAWHVRGRAGEVTTAMVEMEAIQPEHMEHIWSGCATFPGFVGTLSVGPAGIEQLSYLPAVNAPPQHLDIATTQRLIARAAAQVRFGTFDPDEEGELGVALHEDLNPTLAVLAAYEFHEAGRREAVAELLDRFERAGRAVPYDLALLAGQDPRNLAVPVAPGFPLQTRGWLLTDTAPIGREVFAAARKRLSSGAWTSFRGLPDSLATDLVGDTGIGVAGAAPRAHTA